MKLVPVLVLDNSALMKYVLDEDRDQTRVVVQILRQYQQKEIQIIEPVMWYYEAGNVLQLRLADISLAQEGLRVLQKLRFQESWNESMEKIALQICFKYRKVSFYDASYHAIALFHKGVFLTADKRYFEMTKKEGSVELLENYNL